LHTPSQQSQGATYWLHSSFVLTGVMTTLLGPMLPVLSAHWSLSDARAGYFFTAQFVGSMLGVALSGLLVQRCGYRTALVAGLAAMAVGSTALLLSSNSVGLAAVFGYGIGLGLEIPAANLLIAELNPTRQTAAINYLSLFWGIGAVGCPFAVAAFAMFHHTAEFLFLMAAVLTLLSLVLALAPIAMPIAAQPEQPSASTRSIWRSPFLFVLGALFYLYVGTENSLAGWIASYAQQMHAFPGTLPTITPAVFWIGLLGGRGLVPIALRYLRDRSLARLGLLIAAGGAAALLASHSVEVLLIGIATAGLGLASVFPIIISLLPLHYGKMAPSVSGPMFMLAGLGGATLPGLVGAFSTEFGSLKAGLYFPLLGCMTMLALFYYAEHFLTSRT
jgi:MFS transporter, FHS family, glucose/mannose:H+ symporter